ncbi:ABC transporter substrate binding protein [Paludibaculum fermentans]|uniref:histidine kinase n=1 Tax=Paludibaculum fermentans TaxID=1473598 RepID=A0A7S7NR31_PALFE|nr:ABC transporter substrate binding protein [Paludibaculum fermentans]QOY88261.1 PAS domain-containing protein [Paludibaculum fermentans]
MIAPSHGMTILCLLAMTAGVRAGQPSTPGAEVSPPKRNVLILNSYHQNFPWTNDLVLGVEDVLSSLPFEVEVWTEFLDAKRKSGPAHEAWMQETLREKYRTLRLDLIVSSDDDALQFLLKHRDNLFGPVPVVFSGVSSPELIQQLPRDSYTGVVEEFDLQSYLDTALRLFPKVRHVFVVSDASASNQVHLRALRNIARRRTPLHFEFLDGSLLSFGQILEQLRALPPDSMVMTTSFTHDSSGLYVPLADAGAQIVRAAGAAPVFSPNSAQLGQGLAGGCANNGRAHGLQAGNLAKRVLEGAAPGGMSLVRHGVLQMVLDYAVLERHGVAPGLIPAGVLVINRPDRMTDFYARNRRLLWAGAAFTLIQFLIIAAMVANVLRRRLAERQLRASQAHLERAQKLARLGSWEKDPHTGALRWSDEVYRIHGLNSEIFEPTFDHLMELVHPDDRERIRTMAMTADKESRNRAMEYRIMRPDGRVRHVRSYGEFTQLRDGRHMVMGTVQDVTEMKEIEEQFRHVQRVESLGTLAGGIAHDFNNLLTVINGYSQMLLGRIGEGDQNRRLLVEIQRAGQRAADLTRQLLAFSRKQVLQPQVLDLNEVVVSMQGLLVPLLGETVELRFQTAKPLMRVRADRTQLAQVLLNLAANAHDAMPVGGAFTIRTANEEITEARSSQSMDLQPGSYVALYAMDTGSGMDEATRERIFEPFFTTKEVGKGTGLGLSSVYGIVKQSGGHISVFSKPGQGATFRILLPAVGDPEAEAAVQSWGPGRQASQHVILLVEDQGQVRELARETLSQLGYRTYAASSGEQALELFGKADPPVELLITDVVMPGMSGPELAERLLQLNPRLGVLYISGYPGDSLEYENGSGTGRILRKPFLPKDLEVMVEEMLAAVGEPDGVE